MIWKSRDKSEYRGVKPWRKPYSLPWSWKPRGRHHEDMDLRLWSKWKREIKEIGDVVVSCAKKVHDKENCTTWNAKQVKKENSNLDCFGPTNSKTSQKSPRSKDLKNYSKIPLIRIAYSVFCDQKVLEDSGIIIKTINSPWVMPEMVW